jgi:hypothetical protein
MFDQRPSTLGSIVALDKCLSDHIADNNSVAQPADRHKQRRVGRIDSRQLVKIVLRRESHTLAA